MVGPGFKLTQSGCDSRAPYPTSLSPIMWDRNIFERNIEGLLLPKWIWALCELWIRESVEPSGSNGDVKIKDKIQYFIELTSSIPSRTRTISNVNLGYIVFSKGIGT